MLVYMQVEAYILSPKVMAKAVAVPGALVIVAAIGGASLGGILGALVVGAWLCLVVAGADLDVSRSIRPHRVTVGDRCAVDVVLHNGRSILRLPVELTDSLDGEEVTRLTLPQGRRDPAAAAEKVKLRLDLRRQDPAAMLGRPLRLPTCTTSGTCLTSTSA
mgnify:CR=1 FL=1